MKMIVDILHQSDISYDKIFRFCGYSIGVLAELKLMLINKILQTHHLYSTLKRIRNDRFHATRNTRICL